MKHVNHVSAVRGRQAMLTLNDTYTENLRRTESSFAWPSARKWNFCHQEREREGGRGR